jgi:hypothetical protein
MVEGAVQSADSGARVDIADLLENAWHEAVRTERATDVRARLEDWGSGESAIRGSKPAAV